MNEHTQLVSDYVKASNVKASNAIMSALKGTVDNLIANGHTPQKPKLTHEDVKNFRYMDTFNSTMDDTVYNHIKYWSLFTVTAFATRIEETKEWYAKDMHEHA